MLWCGWLGRVWLRRRLTTLPSVKVSHYLQYYLVSSKTFRPLFFSYICPAVFCTFQVPAHPQRGRSPFPLSSSHVDCCYLFFWLPGVPASKTGLNLSLSSSRSIKQLAEEKKPRDYLMWLQREFAHTAGAEGMSAAVPWEAEPDSSAHQGACVAPGSCFHTEQGRSNSSQNHLGV